MKIVKKTKATSLFFGIILACWIGDVCALEVRSPDGKLSVHFTIKDTGGANSCPVYSVSYKGSIVITESQLGLGLEKGLLKEGLHIV